MSEQIDIDINVNTNNIEDVDDLTSKLEEANSQAENLNETSIEPEVNVDTSGVDELNGKLEETESSASSLTTALGGIAGVIGMDQMIETADRINTSYNQLSLTFANTGVSVDELRQRSSALMESTGRSGTQIRDYFNQMGIAGIKNTDLLSSSFESLAGRAYQTNQPIEAMESKMQKMVMTGNAGSRMLTGLGISAEDLGAAMGVTGEEAKDAFAALDQEGRLQVLTQAMGDGATANDMYKDSYAGLKQQAETAMAGLMGAVGQGVLPVITPLIRGATDVVKQFTNGFKSLPGPVQSAIGAAGGFIAIGATVAGTLGVVGKVGSGVVDGLKSIGKVGSGVVDGLKSMKSGYDTVKDAMGTARTMMDALRNSESITEGVRAALAIATGAEATAEGGATAAKTAAIGPTTGLAIAENSLLLPLLLIVGAVVAVIAVMWYLYNTNETVRNGINWLVQQIQNFINSLMPIVNAIINFVTQGLSYLNTFPGGVWGVFLKVLSFVFTWQTQFIQYGIRAAQQFISHVSGALSGIGGAVQSALSSVYDYVTAPFRKAYEYINNNVIKPLKSAWDWVSGAFSGFSGYSSFEGYSGLDDTLNGTISNISSNSSNSNMTINNNFNGLVEESAADYIVNAVNDKLRREKLLRGA